MTFFHFYLNQQYQLRYYFIFFDLNYNLTLYYDNFYQKDIYYSGWSEYISNSIPIEKEKPHELVFLLGESNINDIEKFPETTIFIISKDFANKLENKHRKYKIFLIDVGQSSASYHFRETIFCLIGKNLDKNILRLLKIFAYSSIIIFLIIFSLNIIMTKIISEENRLPIHTLITKICMFSIYFIFLNGLNFIFDSIEFTNFLLIFGCFIFYSTFKGYYYSELFFSLSGDIILSFNENVRIFTKIRNGAIFFSCLLTIVFKVFTYFSNLITELNLLYIKSILEHSILLFCTIYFINKKLLPLYNQVKYEQRIHSELVQCLKFKFQRMLWLNIFMLIYNLFFIISTSIEHDYIYSYIDNIKIHLSLQLFYEAVFFIFLYIIFFPIKLPRYYYDKVIINYKIAVNLRVSISQNRNISISTSNILRKITDHPIVLVNPYISAINQYSINGIHIGIAQ
jgi:hypothetical protein